MSTSDYPHKSKSWRVSRGLLVLLAVLSGSMLAVSLTNAGQSGGWGASELQLQNIDPVPRPVTTTYFSASGTKALTITDLLSDKRSNFYSPTLVAGFTGTVYVDSPGQVRGVVTHLDNNPPGAAQWPLIDDAGLGKTAYVPHYFVSLSNNRLSRIKIHNLEPLPATAVITFYDSSGGVMVTQTGQLPPLGAQFLDRIALGLPTTFQASAVIRANRRIYASVDRILNSAFSSAHAPAQGGYTIVAPMFAAQFTNLNSTLAVQNIGPLTATGVLTYYEATSGSILATRPFTIAPCAAFLVSGVTLPTSTFGHVVATADQPLAGLVLGEAVLTAGLWDYAAIVVDPEQPDTLDRRAAYAPAVLSQYGGWNSQIFAANLGATPASITIEYASAPSGVLTITSRIIQPHSLAVFVNTPTLPREFEHASVKVSSSQLVAATIWSLNLGLVPDPYMAYEAQYAAAIVDRRVYLPVIMK